MSFFKQTLNPRHTALAIGLCAVFAAPLLTPKTAFACGCTGAADFTQTPPIIQQGFTDLQNDVQDKIDDLFEEYLSDNGSLHQWIANDFYNARVLPALQDFTRQMSAIGMQQVYMIGTFFDAKQQIETQRLYQELQVQAHRDYQPSHDFCTFGTNARSLASSSATTHANILALNERQMQRDLGRLGASASSKGEDKSSRWDQFRNVYCNKQDNGWTASAADNSGLARFCASSDAERFNIDIDYTRLIENPRTIDAEFHKDGPKDREEDILALSANLFGHDVLSLNLSTDDLNQFDNQKKYFALRSVAAKRNVAQHSFNSIVSMKLNGSDAHDPSKTREFMAAILEELGYVYDADPKKDEIYKTIGENPSYYAQLEILAKKIYQSPDFFAGLYDKPANITRKSVALKAVELMLDRAIYESQTRQEMALSVLLSTNLNNDIERVASQLRGD